MVPSTPPAITVTTSAPNTPELVAIHPLPLLSIVDHYKRSSLVSTKRVVGVLLGYWTGRVVNVTNSYAVPFEENEDDPTVWYLDHNYHENMSELFKKINAKERPVGWYHTGPKLKASDSTIHDLFSRYCTMPILAVVDPVSSTGTLPITSYVLLEEIREDGSHASRTFSHIPTAIESEEAEEVGVEHLLRNVRDAAVGNLSKAIANKVKSLSTLDRHLQEVDCYLQAVVDGRLPANQQIIGAIQDMFNLLPDVHSEAAQMALTVKTNDQLSLIYFAALAKGVIALNDLISNKVEAMTALQAIDSPANSNVAIISVKDKQ